MAFSQKLFTSLHNYTNPDTRIGELNRIWYDSVGNVFRIQLDNVTPGGTIIGGGSGGSSNYVLPTASSSQLGGVKIGSNITITNGIISVAAPFSGSYLDLTNKPTIPAAQVNSDWNATNGLAQILNKPTLFSGDYLDLTNKPTIPASPVNADWSSVSGLSQILNKPTFATVATSGSYTDLINKPTIPAAGMLFKGFWNAGTNSPTLSANQSGAVAGDVYLTSVAGTRNIGSGSQTYYAGDLLVYDGTYWNDIPGNTGSVTSFNTRTGAVSLTSGDVISALGYVPLYYGSLSAATGSPGSESLTYNNLTGQFTLTPYLLPTASTTQLGGVKVDGTTIVISGGVISSSGTGTVVFKGSWNASTNTPTLSANQVGAQSGWEYIVTVAGTRNLGNGSVTFNVGDLVIYDGTTWNDIPGNAATVTSFNTRTGAVTLQSSDVTTALGFTPIQLSSLSVGTPNSASGSGAISYDNTTGVFKYTPPVVYSTLATLTDVNVAGVTNNQVLTYSTASSKWVATTPASIPTYTVSTASASGGGSLSLSGTTFTFTPANVSSFIALTNLSVTTASASGSGSLAYNNTSGVFTFTPPVIPTVPTYTISTGSASGGGALSLSGTTFTFNPASIPTYTVSTAASPVDGGSLSLSGTTFTYTPTTVYTLPTASPSVLGGVKIDNITISITNGVITANIPTYTVNTTTASGGGALSISGTTFTFAPADVSTANAIPAATMEPMGHADKTQSTIAFNNSTRVFSITPVSGSYDVWVKGVKFTISTTRTVTIPNTTGLYYVYFNSAGALQYQTGYFDWPNQAMTAYIYWNSVTGNAPMVADERHGIVLDWQTHEYLHRTRGAAIANGFGASNYIINGDGSLDTQIQLDIAAGTFFDEDLRVDVVSTNTPTANTWQQDLTGPSQLPMFYLSDTGWVRDNPTSYPLKRGTTRPVYNLNTAGTWSTPDIDNNKFGVTFIIATNNINYPVMGIIGQTQHANQNDAEAVNWSDLSLTGFPIVEFRPLYKVVYQTKTSFGNTPKAIIASLWDLRSFSSVTSSAASFIDANALGGTTLAPAVVNSSLTSVGTLGSLTVQGGTGTYYAARFKGNNTGDQFAIGLSSTAGYGAGNDVLNAAGTAYAPYTISASQMTFKVGSSVPATVMSFDTSGNATIANTLAVNNATTVTYAPGSTTGNAITAVGKDTQGGTGYFDFLKATNTTSGVTNGSKTFRLNSTGTIEIINSAYSATLMSLSNAGFMSVSAGYQVAGKQAVNGPAFRAYVSTAQTLSSGSQLTVTFGAENFDTDNCFTNNTFTPTLEGYYQFNATVRISGGSGTGEVMLVLYKNANEYARGTNEGGTEQGANWYSMQVSDIAYANGTTDSFHVRIQQTSGSNKDTTAGSTISYFSGCMIRGA